MPSKQLHNKVLAGGCETAKHHGPEGRNDLQKHAVPGLAADAAAAAAATGQKHGHTARPDGETPWP